MIFSLFWWLLKLFLNIPAYPCSTRHRRHVWWPLWNSETWAGYSWELLWNQRKESKQKAKLCSEHSSHSCYVAALLSGRIPWSSQLSRVQPYRAWGTEFNKEYYPFANSLSSLFVSCPWTLSSITSYHTYFLRILSLFLYYKVTINSIETSSQLAHGRYLGFPPPPVVSFDLRRKSKGGNWHFN